jgi:hypothetical protein
MPIRKHTRNIQVSHADLFESKRILMGRLRHDKTAGLCDDIGHELIVVMILVMFVGHCFKSQQVYAAACGICRSYLVVYAPSHRQPQTISVTAVAFSDGDSELPTPLGLVKQILGDSGISPILGPQDAAQNVIGRSIFQ